MEDQISKMGIMFFGVITNNMHTALYIHNGEHKAVFLLLFDDRL